MSLAAINLVKIHFFFHIMHFFSNLREEVEAVVSVIVKMWIIKYYEITAKLLQFFSHRWRTINDVHGWWHKRARKGIPFQILPLIWTSRSTIWRDNYECMNMKELPNIPMMIFPSNIVNLEYEYMIKIHHDIRCF